MTCQVRGSEKLKEIMKKILHLGNTLNQGTARGNGISLCAKSIKTIEAVSGKRNTCLGKDGYGHSLLAKKNEKRV